MGKRVLCVALCALWMVQFGTACAQELTPAGSLPAAAPPVQTQAEREPDPADIPLYISEVCSNNDSLWALRFEDYVELYNAGDVALNLSDFVLRRSGKDDCVLPGEVLQPDSYALLRCDGYTLDFNLPKEGCTLILARRDGYVLDEVELPALEDAVWQQEHGATLRPSPGFANDEAGMAAYRATLAQTLVINEVVSSNSSLSPLNDEYYDLIELCNVGGDPVRLSDFWLSDKKKEPLMWQLPDAELAPGECYVVYASGNGNQREAGFKVSADGETLYLATGQGECVDALYVPKLRPDTSYGRSGNDLCYFEQPTIGASNPQGLSSVLPMPQASAGTGLYGGPFWVTLSGQGEVYYTLDGSDPLYKGTLYEGAPIGIAANTTLRAAARGENALPSPVRTWHYLLDAEKFELPLMAISSQPGTVTGRNGLYEKWESRSRIAQVNVAFIENGQEQFNVDCGLKLHGRGSRALKKKSFQIRFRSKYGQSSLEYPVFPETGITRYESLLLRCGSEDYNRAFLRDEFLSSLTATAMPNVLQQAYRPVNVFLDGEYYGLYYLREHVNDSYAAAHLGGEPEDVDMINGWSGAEHGSSQDWLALMRFCRNHNLSNEENLQHVARQISLEGFMDYYIARAYSGDRDYPNIRHVRSAGGDGLWRIVNFDLDWGFGTDPAGLGQMIGTVKDSSALNTVMINALLQNEGFRTQMLERLAYHLQTTYAPQRVLAHLEGMVALVRHDMVYDHERWNLSMEKWEWHLDFLRSFIQSDTGSRVQTMANNARRAFRMTDEEWERYFGGI